ncbi:hypothetical protein NQ315_007467 [Exocentrus adspersus]|uniref:E3 ubiquitin-protein ligase CHFR n=1 Tax=Exocentrus adspersus TaxID=1586481 RepID=A0AAV8VI39_9CUCU|nr:hypothetical protein NQ315_007467 [Exocentrus adspersus]
MNDFPHPKLRNTKTGAVVEVNANPFSIGRGLTCNYILPSKSISRIHCILERSDDNVWILTDKSTNGTVVNGKLVKHSKSPPLKDGNSISLNLDESNSEYRYVFITNDGLSLDITDEQLCDIADAVLSEVELLTPIPVNLTTNQPSESATCTVTQSVPDSTTTTTTSLLHDHVYMAKPSSEGTKRARVPRSPRSGPSYCTRSRTETTSSALPDGSTSSQPETNVDNNTPMAGASSVGISDVALSVNSPDAGAEPIERAVLDVREDGDGSSAASTEEYCVSEPGPSSAKRMRTLSPVEKTPTINVVPVNKDQQQQDNYEVMENELQCVICSELFVKAVTLNCSHSFCKYCIGAWSKNKSDCPICRTKITSTTATIVLDNVIEKVIETSPADIKEHRRALVEERRKLEEEANKPPQPQLPATRTERGRGRGRGGRTRGGRRGTRAQEAEAARSTRAQNNQQPPRINVLDPVAINIGALVGNNSVIEVSSDSDWSSDTESMSPADFRDMYDHDDWYDDYDRPYYGGYGNCFRCGSPTHWANSCPNR